MSNIFEHRSHYRPFAYPWAYDAYKTQQDMHWLPIEAPLAEDVKDWQHELTNGERSLLTQLFRFFTQADTDISEGYAEKYIPRFQHPEIRMMLMAFGAAEANHMDSYSKLIDTLGLPEGEYKAFRGYKEMVDKHEFMFSQDNDDLSDIEQTALDLAIFSAFGEGLQLFSTFAILMNFQRQQRMKGMTTIVEWSIRDEQLHIDSMIKLFRTVISENPEIWTDSFKKRIYDACRSMVELEEAFIDLAFGMGDLKDLTAADVKKYIKFTADVRLNQLGLKENYGVKENPLDWLDWIVAAPTHANFFEQRSTEYSKADPEDWDEAFAALPAHDAVAGAGLSVEIYSKNGCSYCAYAKALSQSSGVDYKVFEHWEYVPESDEKLTWPRIIIMEDGAQLFGRSIGSNEYAEFLNTRI